MGSQVKRILVGPVIFDREIYFWLIAICFQLKMLRKLKMSILLRPRFCQSSFHISVTLEPYLILRTDGKETMTSIAKEPHFLVESFNTSEITVLVVHYSSPRTAVAQSIWLQDGRPKGDNSILNRVNDFPFFITFRPDLESTQKPIQLVLEVL
jgi:hypothetical protein